MKKKEDWIIKSRLTRKLLLTFAGSLIAVVCAIRLLVAVIFSESRWSKEAMYISMFVMIVLLVVAFYNIIDKMVVCKIKKLNDATKKVTDGNYDVFLPVKSKDEFADLANSFNIMTHELKQNTFLSKDFTRYVSHEFKTPLSVIRTYAEAAEGADRQETGEYLNIIISETDRLSAVSKNIMELCRLDSTDIIEKNDVFSPAAQIRTVLLSTQLIWGKKNINITPPQHEEFEIKSNESLLFRVWENLIDNAIKFTGENGSIIITLKKEDGKIIFSVRDDGTGIADEDKDKIFDPFFTGDKSHNKEGSGLGLPLTKSIVQKLGGEIAFESEAGCGSEFTVTLPL